MTPAQLARVEAMIAEHGHERVLGAVYKLQGRRARAALDAGAGEELAPQSPVMHGHDLEVAL